MNASAQSRVTAERPFPGLRPFAYPDHDYFFGREDQTYALYRLIDRYRFIAIVGSSGSGKSSLVRAGLLPLLDDETRDSGGRSWLCREMRPGDAPLRRLTNMLASLSPGDDPAVASARLERIASHLQRSSFGISEALAETNGVAGKSLVLVIDQFEELFRYATTDPGKASPSGNEVRARDEAAQFVQLLLEASRAPSHQIHVMLTMRSDFIGDCSRFHGLPEAVCAAQFLVPSPTRDQLDEVIRGPVEKAGGKIDPELVERLLNDCSSEMDQLPVLQHCLSRLWEEAGKAPVAPSADGSAEPAAARHLTLKHYRDIGEFTDALSRHANEILRDLPGPALQLAVEQTFSALSELDKEGRAIRRALRFSQLLKETGVDELALRQVLDRFRADDCSFLTPSPFDAKAIGYTTRIDVGHEALLRRWEKVSGRGAEPGWLRAEQQAGERYHGLLAMAEGENATLPAHLVDERWAWWKARPRTPAWAERYGGGFSRVQRLLQASQRQQRLKRWAIAAAFVVVLGAAGSMAFLWQKAVDARKEVATSRKLALTTTQISIGRLVGFLNDGTLSAKAAEQFLADARGTLENMLKVKDRLSDTSEIEAMLLLNASDVNVALGQHREVIKLARRADSISQQLVKKYPDNPDFKHLVFASKFRIGDELARSGTSEEVEKEYGAALDLAQQLATSEPANVERKRDVTLILNKIGDLHKYKQNWRTAMEYYQAGLQSAQAAAEKFPGDIATQKSKIAQVLSEKGDDAAALAEYREALAIQQKLLIATPENVTLISNIATTYRGIGGLLKDKPDEARIQYDAAVENSKKLYDGDPGNAYWRASLTTDYTLLGDVLMQKGEWRAASQNYNLAVRIAEGLVLKDPNNVAWRQSLALANLKRGEALVHRGEDVLARPEPVGNESSRRMEDALVRYRIAAQNYERLANNQHAGFAWHRDLFDVRVKIGDVLAGQKKYKEALDAYRLASITIEQAEPTEHVVNWQIRLSAALEQAGDSLVKEAGAAEKAGQDPLAFYEKALDVIDIGTTKEPENRDMQLKKSAITAKIETVMTARQARAQ